MKMLIALRAAAVLMLMAFCGSAMAAVSVTIDDDTAEIEVSLLGGYEADLSVEFEDVVGLSASSLNVSARTVSVTDLSILTRLPDLTNFSIPAAFPVIVEIAPPAPYGLTFSGTATVSIHTHNLNFVANTPQRWFRASNGGDFYDITESMSAGSYRARGRIGGFSEFLIVLDLRAVSSVIESKFDRLDDWLLDHQSDIDSTVYSTLTGLVSQAYTAYGNGNYVTAIQRIDDFIDEVESASVAEIPNVWQAGDTEDNVAGGAISRAATLAFSLRLAQNATP